MLEAAPTGQRGSMTAGIGRHALDLENLRRQYLHNEDRAMVTIQHE